MFHVKHGRQNRVKVCFKCLECKEISAFKVDKRRKNGIGPYCKACVAAMNRTWRRLHPESETNRKRDLRRGRYDKVKAAKWRAEHPEQHRANEKAWRKANPEKARAIKATRLARKRGASGRHTGEQIKKLFVLQKGHCPNCLQSIETKYHVDHIMPLV